MVPPVAYPVTRIGYIPRAVVLAVAIVSVAGEYVLMTVGLNVPVKPLVSAPMFNVTVPLKLLPLAGATDIV